MPSTRQPSRMIAALLAMGVLLATFVAATPTAQAYFFPEDHRVRPSAGLLASPFFFELNAVQIPDDAFPLTLVFVGDPPEGLPLSSIELAIEAAINPWNDVACSYARLQYGGTRTNESREDQEIPIRFVEGEGFFADLYGWASVTSSNPPEQLAIWLNRDRYRWALTADPFARPPGVDLVAVLTHEIGHILGLAHSTAHGNATMWGGYLSDGSQRMLSADDKAGLCSRYPTEEQECSSDSDCLHGPCAQVEDFQVCDTWRGEPGDYCGLELQHCQDFCAIVEESIGVGYCSAHCSSDADCPSDFVCAYVDDSEEKRSCLWSPELPSNAQGCVSSPQRPDAFHLLLIGLALAVFRRRRRTPGR